MIACRPFSRVDLLWKATRSASSLFNRRLHLLQGFCCNRNFVPRMGGGKDGPNIEDLQKKRKSTIWSPVSTPSVFHGGCTVKDSKTNSGYSHQEGDGTIRPDVACEDREVQCYGHQYEDVEGRHASSSLGEIEVLLETRESHESITGSESDLHKAEIVEQEDAVISSAIEKHSVSVEVDASLIRFIKGKGGSTQMQIEKETGVKIRFPSSKEENYVVLEGISIESVTKASEKIASALEEAVKSPSLDYSHFISLPLAIHPELVDKLERFQNSVLGDATSVQDGSVNSDSNEDSSDDKDDKEKESESSTIPVKLEIQSENEKEHVRVKIESKNASCHANKPSKSSLSDLGIDKSIFIKPKTFHLTVLMLKLWNKDRIAAATEVLQKSYSKVKDALDNRPVSIRLKGLECMRGSPSKARVLYAPVEEIGQEGRLAQACQIIIEAYIEAGLVLEKDARQTLKLHATLMNARHRKRSRRTRRHDSFDARDIYKRYGSEEWGDYLIREAHLSQRFKFDESGYYHCCTSIPFPESMQVE